MNATKNIQIRAIQKKDNEVVANLIRSVMTQFGAVGEGYSIMDSEVDSMFESYTNDKAHFWVIEKDGTIVGCGGIGPLEGGDEYICELKKMYFYEDIRGLGLGKELVKLCLEKSKELGYKQCYLETLERMTAANYLYKKMGFKKLKTACGCTGHGACDSYYSYDL